MRARSCVGFVVVILKIAFVCPETDQPIQNINELHLKSNLKQLGNIKVNKNETLGTKTALVLHLAAARCLNHSVLEMHTLLM